VEVVVVQSETFWGWREIKRKPRLLSRGGCHSSEKYHQRNLVESAMRFKSKYGVSVRAKGLRAIQAEIYLRMIASNLMLKVKETFN
jgi:hypothetical protein